MEFLEANNPEWWNMWTELASLAINNGDPICANKAECWEYMGSTLDHHWIRHPKHPTSQKEEYAYIERRRASISWAQTA